MTLSSREGQRVPDVDLCRLRDGALVPQVFIDGKHIGGADQLAEYLKAEERPRSG